jgi:hypothetical protein
MPYSPAELASFTPALRADAEEAIKLLNVYADVERDALTFPLAARIEQIAKTFDLCGWDAERDAIVTAYNELHQFVSMKCRHTRDGESAYSLINYYPEGHKLRRSYEVRVAAEKRELQTYPTAKARILATVGLKLSGTTLDATLNELSHWTNPDALAPTSADEWAA